MLKVNIYNVCKLSQLPKYAFCGWLPTSFWNIKEFKRLKKFFKTFFVFDEIFELFGEVFQFSKIKD